MITATIEFPKKDVEEMVAQIHRGAMVLGQSLGAMIKLASNKIALSMGTSTKVAQKYRNYWEDVFWDKLGGVEGSRKTRSKKKRVYVVESWKGGKQHTFNVRANSEAELKKMRAVKIGRRGLAKASWQQVAAKTGAGGSAGDIAGRTFALAGRFGTVEAKFRGDDPYAVLRSQLNYAEDALVGGPKPVEDAMRRAAEQTEITIDWKVMHIMGAT